MPDMSKKNPTSRESWIRNRMFHKVPFNVAVIDRDYNIVDANERFAEHFGEWRGKKCYAAYKKLKEPCAQCNSLKVFEDGKTRVIDEVGIDLHGRQTHYVVHIAPLRRAPDDPIEYVLEMSSEVTETKRWQQEYQILFDRVPCYITVIDENYRIVRANESFRENFGDVIGQNCYKVYKRRNTKCPHCPAARTFKNGGVYNSTQHGIDKKGQDITYRVTTSPLTRGGEKVAHVIEISTDLTDIKKLEQDVIEAERLGAVGQTVAGLAHSIKNILMGLEGGKYIVSVGLQKDDKEMINQGWEMLERNFDKTTTLVKDFLSFSKGRLPELQMVNPNDLAREIVDLYRDTCAQSGIKLTADLVPTIKKAPLDPDGIHTCLTNLVSNAIDACQMGEQKGTEVMIRVREVRGKLVFEVADNGSGIDYEIKQKIFTTFFTTKGGMGTGLGLLTTRKIVQEHGGKIIVESKKGQGARFRMEFPRSRLLTLFENAGNHENKN